MKKQLFLLSLVIVASTNLIFADFNYNSSVKIGQLTYYLDTSNKKAAVKEAKTTNGYHVMYRGEVEVPSTVTHNGVTYKVTNIEQDAFKGDTLVTSIIIGKNIEVIEDGAFAVCKMSSLTFLPTKKVTNGRTTAVNKFKGCTNLKNIYFPEDANLKAWCESSWGYRDTLYQPMSTIQHIYLKGEEVTDLIIPEGTDYIAPGTFYKSHITSVQIPSTCKKIWRSAFKGCTNITSITFKEGIEIIEDEAFSGCNNRLLKTLKIPTTLQSIGYDAFMTCQITKLVWNAKNCTGPIADNTFARSNLNYNNLAYKNITLKHITFGEQVVSLPDVFKEMYILDTIIFKSINPPSNIVFNCTKRKCIYVPCGSRNEYIAAICGTSNEYDCINQPCGECITKLKTILREEPAPYKITLSCNKQQGSVSRTGASCELTFDISATPKSNYYFLQWSDGYTDNPRTITLTQDTIFTAEFAKQGCHIITFTNWDGKILQKLTDVEDGATPIYTASTPTRPSDSQYHYTFCGWSPDIVPATANATYVAQYQAVEKSQEELIAEEKFRLVSSQNGSSIGLASLASHQIIEYSTDGSTWTNMTTTTTISLNNGDSIYLRGVLSANNTSTDYTKFTMRGAIAAYGNINYLWDYENIDTPLKEYCGANLFRDCAGLIYAPILPSTELADYCYIGMFRGCSSLSTAPVLPAMTLTDHCYCSMFRECASLTSAPSLPATTLATSCYTSMFQDCSNLASAPTTLPAATLADYCYQSMFSSTAISTAPELPATVLALSCYNSMFRNCVNLRSAPSLPATIIASECYKDLFYDCIKLSSAPSLPATTLAPNCYQGMFHGCTSLTSAPSILPATNLTTYCYNQMFMQTAITSAPELPAKVLADYSYYQMFYGCDKLNYIKCFATDISATGCTQGWVNGVASSGTFVKNSQMNSWTIGNNGIPNGWTTQRETPTSIEITNSSVSTVRRVIRNGQIFIIRGGKTYTLQGQEVR